MLAYIFVVWQLYTTLVMSKSICISSCQSNQPSLFMSLSYVSVYSTVLDCASCSAMAVVCEYIQSIVIM